MTYRNLLARLAILVVFTVLSSTSYADHSWNNYHWARMANPLPLLVVNSVTGDWQTELDDSLVGWNDSSVLDLSVASANNKLNIRKRCKMVLGQIRICNASYGYNGWLGIATIGIDSNSHIVQGTAKVNDSYATYWTIEGEKNHVMCQEMGHLFGLSHTSEDGSSQQTCMDYSQDPESQWPNEHDYVQLDSIYEHLDSFNSYDDGSGGEDAGVCNAPPGKGCNKNGANGPPMGVLVHRGKNHEIWVANRKAGGLWIHHVRLAPKNN